MASSLQSGHILAQSLKEAVDQSSGPEQFSFLDGFNIDKPLSDAIKGDILTKPPQIARIDIINRLRLDLFSKGSLDASLLQQRDVLPDLDKPLDRLEAIRAQMRQEARTAVLKNTTRLLVQIAPDAQVIKLASTQYRNFQTNPGIDVNGQSSTPDAPRYNPQFSLFSGPQTVQDGGGVATAQQTNPGRDVRGLKDCKIAFENLDKKCVPVAGSRCEQYDSSKFPEVAKIDRFGDTWCSGTLIGERWVISAAHCFLDDQSAAVYIAGRNDRVANGIPVLRGNDLAGWRVSFPKSIFQDPFRPIQEIFINPDWMPAPDKLSSVTQTVMPGDLAIIHLTENGAIPSQSINPAVLMSSSYHGLITTAGYGLTTLGVDPRFSVTWPELPVSPLNNQLQSIQPQASTFCRGDSGGPAYQGRQRGCGEKGEAHVPHPIVGVASYHSDRGAVTDALTCQSAPVARFTDITAAGYRDWICKISSGEVQGCVYNSGNAP